MTEAFTVEVKDAKKLFYRIRGRFLKLQQVIIAEALLDASEPVVAAAQANAPARTGLLRSRIAPTLVRRRGRVSVLVGPVRLTRNEKRFPFYGLFLEKGWWLTGHTPKDRAGLSTRQARAAGLQSRKASRKRIRFIPGRRFLQRAGESQFQNIEKIFAAKVFKAVEQIEAAGAQAGFGLIH